MSIAILAPLPDSAIESDRFIVTGAVSDPLAMVLVNDTLAKVEDGFFEATVFTCAPPGPIPVQTGSEPDVCTITVTAYAHDGQVATQTLTYTHVPSEAPLTVTISEPSPEKRFTFSPVEIKGTINDVLSGFSPTVVTVNGVRAIVRSGAFSALVPLEDGKNNITVHAENLVGSDAYDTTRVIYEPLGKPLTLLVTSPVAPFIVNHSPITISGDVNDSSAAVDVNGIPAEQDFRSFQVASLPLSIGLNMLTVAATRPNGERVTSTLQVTYDPNAPLPPPPILGPLSPYARTSFIEVTGLTHPLFHVGPIVNGVIQSRVQADADGRFTATVFLGPDQGFYHLSARAVDPNGNIGPPADELLVIKDTWEPIVWAPNFNTTSLVPLGFPIARAHIGLYTEPFADVEVTIDNGSSQEGMLFSTIADEIGRFSITTHLSTGQHRMSIKATDRAGNTGTLWNHSPFINVLPGSPFLIQIADPPTIDPLPTPINENMISIEGNAYANAEIELYRNKGLIGTVTADQQGRYLFENVALLPRNILKVRQKELKVLIFSLGDFQFGSHTRYAPIESSEVAIDVIPGVPARPEVKIEFPPDGAVTNAEFLPLRGTVGSPDAVLRVNTYYTMKGTARNEGGRFVSDRKIPLLPGKNVLWVEAVAPDGSRGVDKITVFSRRDAAVPSVKLTRPVKNESTVEPSIRATGEADPSVRTVIVNEAEAVLGAGGFTADSIDLSSRYGADPRHEGKVVITAWALDDQGRIGEDRVAVDFKDLPVPQLFVLTPQEGEGVTVSSMTVTGEVFDATEVTVNGRSAQIAGRSFSLPLELVEGDNRIVVIARNAAKAKAQTLTVTYRPSLTLTSLVIEDAKTFITKGEAFQLRAVGVRGDGSRVDLTSFVDWSSSTPAVATISDRGFVTSIGRGSTILSAGFNGLTGHSQLIVDHPILRKIEIAHEEVFDQISIEPQFTLSAPILEVGKALRLTAFGTYSDGALFVFGSGFNPPAVWAGSDPAVASVDPLGRLTALRAGTVQVTASFGEITGRVTVTVRPPPISLFITDPLTETITTATQVTVSGVVWTKAQSVEVRVNGLLAQVTGERFVVTGVPLTAGNNTLIAEATDSNGATAAHPIKVQSFPVPPLQLFITDPVGGSSVSRDEVTVQGTVITQAPEVGVKVNGILAQVFGDRFVANGVPLTPGTNRLTVQATDSSGATAMSGIIVQSNPAADRITLRSNIESGIAPLEITLRIESSLGGFSTSPLSFSGPAAPEITPVSPEEYRVHLTTEGIYSFTATVTDLQGQTFSDTIVITVLDRNIVEDLLRSKWEGMRTALLSGDVEMALSYFTPQSRQKYRYVFERLRSNLPAIAGRLQPIRLTDLQGNAAECFTNRMEDGVLNAYFVYFVLDSNGLWKLVEM